MRNVRLLKTMQFILEDKTFKISQMMTENKQGTDNLFQSAGAFFLPASLDAKGP